MYYQAKVIREGDKWSAEFPDCPGCQTCSDSMEELQRDAKEAVEGWLECQLVGGRVPPQPKEYRGEDFMRVDIDPILAVRLQIRLARHAAGMTQQDLAKRAGVSQQQIAKLEHPDLNPNLATLVKVAKALGMVLDIRFEKKGRVVTSANELPQVGVATG